MCWGVRVLGCVCMWLCMGWGVGGVGGEERKENYGLTYVTAGTSEFCTHENLSQSCNKPIEICLTKLLQYIACTVQMRNYI